MTDDDLPDIRSLEEGDEVRIFYKSERSGNEVSREGRVELVREGDGERIVYIHTEKKEPLKQVYAALMEAETTSGRDVVAAYSVTAEPDELPFDDHPELGDTYTFTMDVARSSILGVVDRIVSLNTSTNFLIADGGR